MTREELKNKLFDIILKNSSPTMVVERTIDYQQTMAIVEELINHETDLLKEFVESYKKVLIKDYDDKAFMMNHSEEQEIEDRYYYRGQCNAISRLLVLLDRDLEKFLEEKK